MIKRDVPTNTQDLTPKTLLVTGGAGFIGSRVAASFANEGYRVVIVDDLSTGKRENIPRGIKFYHLDICNNVELEKVFSKEKPQYVSHHAAQINVRRSVSDPCFDAQINILGMINVLENCRRHNARRIVFASSGGVLYGEGEDLPFDEKSPLQPFSPYGASKCSGEHYLHCYAQLYDLEFISLRYSNVYGPGQDPSGEAGVIAIFILTMLKGTLPTIFGDGEQLRDYVYIDDIVMANKLALKKGGRSAFNIGTGRPTSVNELFRMIAREIGFPNKPIYAPCRQGEILKNCLDIARAEVLLDWKPTIQLEEGIKKTIASFKKKYV
ncbi:NAD-dependent epimerase/dehydratase family protein [candidate division NPL-UPA2 bacterium Unc8]|uniref:NAD-dependent epimerase/dehydratase family protein n=1 Tax=candidate division NPL-UPA2 bacterium Unc8 TaxID=1980939 RepID=A0A399G070_UNCN2|nr:UDP-glucose 4-epimerase [Bacillota bacterium]MBT9138344.1 UDP-glucose 4-epimerase [Bacillota bacterium]MBT9148263.1 UDP-glucose 4-epimerase [Bacillota bacterium]RII00990.1 MAG: NAD-dependent epimerase/dehydratase family protein [candidate division NPL-UPA2 bacterium Unc8]